MSDTDGADGRPGPTADDLAPGTAVEVRRKLDGQWARGFEVVERELTGTYRVRRMSDGQELPVPIAAADLREQRRRSSWWY